MASSGEEPCSAGNWRLPGIGLAHWAASLLGVVAGVAIMLWIWSRAASISADGAHYMELGAASVEHGPRAGMDWYSGPGYPVPTGWLYMLTGDLETAGRLCAFLFGLGAVVAAGLLGWRLFGPLVGCVTAALLSVHYTFTQHAVMAETDVPYLFWVAWSLLCMWELSRSSGFGSRFGWALAAGVCFGFGYLTRPESVPLASLVLRGEPSGGQVEGGRVAQPAGSIGLSCRSATAYRVPVPGLLAH